MPEKSEVLSSIVERTYQPSEVKCLVNSVKTSEPKSTYSVADYLKVGDVFIDQAGLKSRPFVVLKVENIKGVVVAVPLTTTEDSLALTPYTSRFFKDGWFTNQLITVKMDNAIANFAGVLENPKAIKQLKLDLKEFYKEIL